MTLKLQVKFNNLGCLQFEDYFCHQVGSVVQLAHSCTWEVCNMLAVGVQCCIKQKIQFQQSYQS